MGTLHDRGVFNIWPQLGKQIGDRNGRTDATPACRCRTHRNDSSRNEEDYSAITADGAAIPSCGYGSSGLQFRQRFYYRSLLCPLSRDCVPQIPQPELLDAALGSISKVGSSLLIVKTDTNPTLRKLKFHIDNKRIRLSHWERPTFSSTKLSIFGVNWVFSSNCP